MRAANKWSRKLHRWGAIFTLAPLLLVIATGLLLQLKKQVPWIQPPTQRGSAGGEPSLSFQQILEIASGVPDADIADWDDIDRLDVQPGRGMVKVQAKSRYEVQIDTRSGEVLQVAYRRSDLIEKLHDGSFFGDVAKLWIFLPSGAVLLCLWLTGAYLWLLPIVSKRAGRIRRSAARASHHA